MHGCWRAYVVVNGPLVACHGECNGGDRGESKRRGALRSPRSRLVIGLRPGPAPALSPRNQSHRHRSSTLASLERPSSLPSSSPQLARKFQAFKQQRRENTESAASEEPHVRPASPTKSMRHCRSSPATAWDMAPGTHPHVFARSSIVRDGCWLRNRPPTGRRANVDSVTELLRLHRAVAASGAIRERLRIDGGYLTPKPELAPTHLQRGGSRFTLPTKSRSREPPFKSSRAGTAPEVRQLNDTSR